MRMTLLAICFCYGGSVAAPLAVVPEKSRLGFTFKQMNVPVEGQFKKFTAQVRFDPEKPETSVAALEVDLASVDAGSVDATAELAGPVWFNRKVFPSAKFVAHGTKALGGGKFQMVGKLTLKGKTQDVTAQFTLSAQQVAEGQFVLKRGLFAIGEGEWADESVVAHDVLVRFRLQMQTVK